MKKKLAAIFFDDKRTWLFFLLLFLFQFAFIFQGIDFNDEGSYGALYQQIFKNPHAVQFSFMYWMSGIIGGVYLHFFPSFGLLALRLGGVLVTMSTIFIVYNLLKKHIPTAHLKLGLLITTLLFNRESRGLFYDNLTPLFFVLMIALLYYGLEQRKPAKLFICGLLLSVNMFIRLPNVLGLTLGLAILYYAFVHKLKWQYLVKLVVIYASGFAIGVLAIIAVMKYTGQFDVFMDSLAIAKEMGKNKENSHNIVGLIFAFLNQYPASVSYALEFLAAVIVGVSVTSKLRERYTNITGLLRILGYGMLVVFFVLLVKEKFITMGFMVMLITGLSLVACFFLILKKNHPLSLLALMGAIMTLVSLFGSDTGLEIVGKYALWVALPIATGYYFSIVTVDIKSDATYSNSKALDTARLALYVSENQLREVRKYIVCGIVIAFVFFAWSYPTWNNSFNRTEMRYPIRSNFLKGIFTTRAKAEVFNELMAESSKYVKKDDYVLAFDAISLYYPMTETVPFIGCSWPQLYDKEVFKEQLDKAVAEKKILPVVVYEKGNNLSINWPDPVGDEKNVTVKSHPGEAYMNQFLAEKQYKLVWENKGFRIYIPPKGSS